jgi:hypothetical protein
MGRTAFGLDDAMKKSKKRVPLEMGMMELWIIAND